MHVSLCVRVLNPYVCRVCSPAVLEPEAVEPAVPARLLLRD